MQTQIFQKYKYCQLALASARYHGEKNVSPALELGEQIKEK